MGNAVLVVHSDHLPRELARQVLESAGHSVAEVADLSSGLRTARMAPPDLLLLEWTDYRALRDALDRLRDEPATGASRVVVWADRGAIPEAIHALELGVDDCLAIPFERVELVARVNACLRRSPAGARPDQIAAGPLVLDKAGHCLWVNDRPVDLAPTEFRLLAFLLENRGRVFGRDELLRRAWPRAIKAGHRTVDVHVRRLREHLEPFGLEGFIQTVRGFGYRLGEPGRMRIARASAPRATGDAESRAVRVETKAS
ncbi:MAG TPA: winged helix-turn-helix domain-containing protein [Gammaproteobacteria bacterium]|jgi:two-component system phosphate regulon response regulator PhoB|nr:winged helix-turn-helix domain-containing protein [Gammaproteobacteria bacterium]